MGRLRRKTGRAIEGINAEAESALLDYDWPGNVRELENAMEFAFVKARSGEIGLAHLPPEIRERRSRLSASPGADPAATPAARRRSELSPDRIAAALSGAKGNIAEVARQLGISRTTIYKKIRQFNLARRPEQR